MRINRKLLFFVLGLGLQLISCGNFTNRLAYFETQCADPWQYNIDEVIHEQNVLQYLGANGVQTGNIIIKESTNSLITCSACDCSSGRKVIITVTDEDVAMANSLGFY